RGLQAVLQVGFGARATLDIDQALGDFAEAGLDRLLVAGERLALAGARLVDARLAPAGVEDRHGKRITQREDARAAREQVRERGALRAEQRGQRHAGEERRARDADLRVRRDQALLGRADV